LGNVEALASKYWSSSEELNLKRPYRIGTVPGHMTVPWTEHLGSICLIRQASRVALQVRQTFFEMVCFGWITQPPRTTSSQLGKVEALAWKYWSSEELKSKVP
jgi:hypothetical protein